MAQLPWRLFFGALMSDAGWVTMGAVTVNAAIAPGYVRARPVALAKAYNGASIGVVVFSPLWVMLIAHLGFSARACLIGLAMVAVTLPRPRGKSSTRAAAASSDLGVQISRQMRQLL